MCLPSSRRKTGQYWIPNDFPCSISCLSRDCTASGENGPPMSPVTARSHQSSSASGRSSAVQLRKPSRAEVRKYSIVDDRERPGASDALAHGDVGARLVEFHAIGSALGFFILEGPGP